MNVRRKTCPTLLLGYADSAHAAACGRCFRRQGWHVHQTQSSQEVRRLARRLEPELVLLDIELAEESGWLTAAKLLSERPGQKLLLVGRERTDAHEERASILGAAGFVAREEIAGQLEDELRILVPVPA